MNMHTYNHSDFRKAFGLGYYLAHEVVVPELLADQSLLGVDFAFLRFRLGVSLARILERAGYGSLTELQRLMMMHASVELSSYPCLNRSTPDSLATLLGVLSTKMMSNVMSRSSTPSLNKMFKLDAGEFRSEWESFLYGALPFARVLHALRSAGLSKFVDPDRSARYAVAGVNFYLRIPNKRNLAIKVMAESGESEGYVISVPSAESDFSRWCDRKGERPLRIHVNVGKRPYRLEVPGLSEALVVWTKLDR